MINYNSTLNLLFVIYLSYECLFFYKMLSFFQEKNKKTENKKLKIINKIKEHVYIGFRKVEI